MRRRLAAILAADIAGFSRLVRADEEGTLDARRRHRAELIDPLLARFGGRVANTAGDSLLIEFPSAVEAARCAVALQEGMAARNAAEPADRRIDFRIGLNVGDVVAEGDDLLGDGVNVAARLEALAPPGGILMSRTVRDQIRDHVELALADLGEVPVKNIDRPVRVFQVLREGEAPLRLAGPARGGRLRIAGLVAAALLAAAAIALWQLGLWPGGPGSEAGLRDDRPSIAVLPFANLSEDGAQDYFADGLTDDLITNLSKVSGLLVIARNSVFTFKGRAVRVDEVAEDLGVRYVVEGTVRRVGDRLRVNAQLIDGTTGRHVWAERYDRRSADLFAVQDELVARIVSALAVRLTQREQSRLQAQAAPTLEAYELYLRARDGYYSRDAERMRESLDLFARAWAADPDFAKAYAGYARLAAEIWRVSAVRGLSSVQMRRVAELAAQKAIAIDPTLADAYSVLALVKMIDAEHDEAVRLARRAVDLDPNSADAHATLALVLSYAGDPEAALDSIRTTMRLDPKPATSHLIYHGLVLFLNRHYDDAIAVLEPLVETPDRGLGDGPREILAMAYAESGDLTRARAQVAEMRRVEIFLNLNYFRVIYSHHARAADVERRIDALRAAGLPDWPLGQEVRADLRLQPAEIGALITDTTWSGTDDGRRSAFIQEFDGSGGTVFASENALLTGAAFIHDDELCERYEGFVLGRALCGPVLRNPAGDPARSDEYVYVNVATVRRFSPAD